MAIPISPSLVAAAKPYTGPQAATSINMYKKPEHGAKCISMQFVFDTSPSWLVKLGEGVRPALDQVASLYVDASQSTHDVNILFPDTGYQVRINQGSCRNVPVITGTGKPTFYVLLDSSGATSATDIVNIIALNVPANAFESDTMQNVLPYGFGNFYSLIPSFIETDGFPTINNLLPAGNVVTLIPHTTWYISAINISVIIQGNNSYGYLRMYINQAAPIVIFNFPFFSNSGAMPEELPEKNATGLQISNQNIPNGSGPLLMDFVTVGGYGTPLRLDAYVNIGGGILVN